MMFHSLGLIFSLFTCFCLFVCFLGGGGFFACFFFFFLVSYLIFSFHLEITAVVC